MGTLRSGSAKDKTVLTRRRLTIPDESTQGRPRGTNVMDNVKGMFRDLTPEELLGPLNDVERRFAPAKLFTAGPMEIPLPRPRVAIVGSRMASEKGLDTAAEIAKTLSRKRVVTVNGLAEGIDAVAHKATIEERGWTVAVLGTPLDKVYPRKNLQLQEEIMAGHLAVSQFPIGHPIQPGNFVMRNKTMALISNASIMVEAEALSGSRHVGWETLRLGRPLFISKSVASNESMIWPSEMIRQGALRLDDPEKVVELLRSESDTQESS